MLTWYNLNYNSDPLNSKRFTDSKEKFNLNLGKHGKYK